MSERDYTILQWAFKLKSALATAETRDLNGHKVNKCIMKQHLEDQKQKSNSKALPAELLSTEMNLPYTQNWQFPNAIC
jgi:hypothetical protein